MDGPAHSNPRFLPSLRTCDQNSLIPSSHYNGNYHHHHHHHHQSFKWPRISETTSKRRVVPYKSEVCLKFQRGTCNYGEHCRFAHDIGDIQFRRGFVPPNPIQPDNNPSSNLGICWRYSSYGECPYGDRCHFIHQEGVGLGRTSVAINIVNGGTARTGGGPSSDRKGLNAGDKLQGYEKPAGWRTRMCIKWRTTGSCPYGPRCYFAHGESELQKRVWGKASECLSTSKQQALGKQWVFKWNDVEKISRIYADWIPNTLLVDGSSGTVRS